MTTYTAEERQVLSLGRQGEYNVTQITFDLSGLEEIVGAGTAALIHYPYSGEPYIVPTVAGQTYDAAVQDGTSVIWTIGQLATMYSGDGIVVANWISESGVKKSRRYKTKCYRSIAEAVDIPDVQQSYIDQMAELSAEIVAELQAAEELAEGIETAVESAQTTINNAANAAIERVEAAEDDADDKIADVEEAITAANNKITQVEAAGAAALAAAQAAANVTVVNECLVYGGAQNG